LSSGSGAPTGLSEVRWTRTTVGGPNYLGGSVTFIIDQRLVHLTPHMFTCHRSHSWISGGDHFLVKNSYVFAFGIIENGRSWLFSTKMGVMWPLIFDQRLVHLTPHMFPCHRSHSWISGGDHFVGQKSVGVSLRYY
jgi:hypothetical protein